MNMYEDAGKMTKEATDNALKSFAAMSKGFQQISTETADFTKRSYETQTAMMEKIFQAKSLDKTIELQSEYAKTTYETWVAQMTKVADIYADIAKQTYRPFEQTVAASSGTMTKIADKTAAATKETVAATEKKAAAAAN